MPLKPGQAVEYDRQRGAPPVIAVLLEVHQNGTATVRTIGVLDDDDRIISGFRQQHEFRLPVEELRRARKYHDPEAIR